MVRAGLAIMLALSLVCSEARAQTLSSTASEALRGWVALAERRRLALHAERKDHARTRMELDRCTEVVETRPVEVVTEAPWWALPLGIVGVALGTVVGVLATK